jgi:hypothetical protein
MRPLFRATVAAAVVILGGVVFGEAMLHWLLRDPYPEKGGALVFFINEGAGDVRIVSLHIGALEVLGPAEAASWLPVSPASGRASRTMTSLSAPAGNHVGTVEYRVGTTAAPQRFSFNFDLVALNQCDIRIWFAPAGPRASPCTDPRPASYGGTVRH